MNKSKNDLAWEQVFEKYNLIEQLEFNKRVSISSSQINKFREARLMAKFDHRSQLPKIFTQHQLSILPISRGTYEIGPFETFCDFNADDNEDVIDIDFPIFLESLDCQNIINESMTINCTLASKILHNFIGEEYLLPTVSGRMRSSPFEFTIKSENDSFNIQVDNAQIEIDGGYEGDNSLILIEAKNYISNDFLIRQLYYPYRLWNNKIKKQVRPIFLSYSNGIFHLREFEFTTPQLYNSIRLVKQQKYSIRGRKINKETIKHLLHKTKLVPEPPIPFPQADSFERIINLCELLKQRGFTEKNIITQNYDFDYRQTDYYINAASYLGLVRTNNKTNEKGVLLTQQAEDIFNLPLIERQLKFVELILSHKVFQKALHLYFDKSEREVYITRNEAIQIMKSCKLYNVRSESTYNRRASTIISWIKWIVNLIDND